MSVHFKAGMRTVSACPVMEMFSKKWHLVYVSRKRFCSSAATQNMNVSPSCPLILLSEHAIYCLQIYLQNDEIWNYRSLISDRPVTWALLCTGGGDEHQSSGGRYWAKKSISITIVTNKQTCCLWRIVHCYCTEGRKRWGKKYGSIQDWLPHYECVIINDIIWM